MKSPVPAINKLSLETVDELNRRILSGKFTADNLSLWLKQQGFNVHAVLISNHAQHFRDSTPLSLAMADLERLNIADLSEERLSRELSDLEPTFKKMSERIRCIKKEILERIKDKHKPEPSAVNLPYAEPSASQKEPGQ